MKSKKEEAVQAMCIAEKRMQCHDFVGAQKLAIEAQQLFPDLENMSQMLTVCEVHCSAETKVNGSEDWYGILQVESTADESLIKKQYRKLALLLHPDKNKFAGAEAAFKLVGEAHRTLSDKAKRSVYDMKRKVTIPTMGQRRPPHRPNNSSNAKKQPAAPNIDQDNATTPWTQQQTQTASVAQTFWTSCPFCGTRYQHYRTIINKALRCQNCLRHFIAYDLNAQGVKSTSQQSHRGVSSCIDAKGNSGGSPIVPELSSRVGIKDAFSEGTRNKVKENSKVGNGIRKEHETEVKNVKLETVNKREPVVQLSGNPSWKHRREVESSDTDSADIEDMIIEESEYADAWNAEVMGLSQRKSTRQKHSVSYSEDTGNDNDFENLTNSKHMRKELHTDVQSDKASSEADVEVVEVPTCATTVSNGKLEGRKRGSISSKGDIPNEIKMRKHCMEESGDLDVKDVSGRSSKDVVGSISDSSASKLDSGTLSCPDPEFYNFDEDRDESCFAVDQTWALYDDLDGMPRFYALIRSVSSRSFKLCFTWLEYYPIGRAEMDWSDEGLPVSCGNFIRGETKITEDICMFSHIMPMSKGSKVNCYGIYPRKGEIWALFKDWDIKWRSNSDQHRKYKYDFVEILSDFAPDAGANAACLVQVKGFVSLFCRGRREGISTLHIPPNEILRFSHMVPSYRMTGKEREGIPEGFFELDPASLPYNLTEKCASVTLDEIGSNAQYRVHVNGTECFKSRTVERKSADDLQNDFTFKNIEEANENIAAEKHLESSDTSADGLNGGYEKKHSRASRSHSTAIDVERTVCRRDSSKNLENAKENDSDARSDWSKNLMEDDNGFISEPSEPMVFEYPDPEFHNFESERLEGKFQTGQLWALFCEDDGFPKYYALVRKVDAENFKVHVTWLEALPQLEEEIKWSDNNLPFACGRFRLCSGGDAKAEYDTVKVFSHLVRAEPVDKRRYDIYPRANEVWALFKNWSVEWKASDLDKCLEKGEYEVVEVLSSLPSIITVMVLEKVGGFKSVFKSRRKIGVPNTMYIPCREFLRFSHQIPSFQLTEERGGRLRGYWELDPASVPDILLCTDPD